MALVGPVLFGGQAAVFGAAWWTIWREKRSARSWGLAASLVYMFFPLSFAFLIGFFSRSVSWSQLLSNLQHTWVLLAIGVAGLVGFWRRYEPTDSRAKVQRTASIPGDGTLDFLSRAMPLISVAAALAIYSWWHRWVQSRNISIGENFFLTASLIGLIIVTVHELAHTAMGLALGMKLWAFVVGPFQWLIQDGHWTFQFRPKQILSGSGATSVVPATPDFSHDNYLYVVAAGPVVTLITGILAMWIATKGEAGSVGPTTGYCLLFGLWSLTGGLMNLIPFRTVRNYSDGAKIYQLLSDGPWADYHRISGVVGSSLVTSLRPRDFDILTIQRAARDIAYGSQGLILRLYVYVHFLDQGRLTDAAEALHEAELIYQQSSLNIPPELHTDFVFGNAYARRDAVAAREWWARLKASKPTRFNSDYWRAYSSLQWIEGNLKEANEAWEKANALAQQLPTAGAYEFDRYCCSLLRKVLDEAATATPILVRNPN